MKCSRHWQKTGGKIRIRADKTAQKMVKIKDTAQIRSRVSISSTSPHYWSAPRGWRHQALDRLGILHPLLPKLTFLLESQRHIRCDGHFTPLSVLVREYSNSGKKSFQVASLGKKLEKTLCSQVVSIKKNLMMARGSQGTGFVPAAKYQSREHVIPDPVFPTFSSQPNTQQSWLWLSQLHQTAFSNYFSLQDSGHLFRHLQQTVEDAFNSHGFNYLNIQA